MRKLIYFFILFLLPLPAAAETLSVDPDQPVHKMSPTLYGLFFEDINHAADGGLYAELLQNRSFENQDLLNPTAYQHLNGWQFNSASEGSGKISISSESPLHESNPTYVRVETDSPGYAFQNLGYGNSAFRGGIPVAAGENYDVSVWLRSVGETGTLEVCLTTRAGSPLSSVLTVTPGNEWEKHSGVLTAEADSEEACLTFTVRDSFTFDVDMASLMPQDRIGVDWPGGGVRRDLTEALAALHPRFLRFPGGCVAEGSYTWDNLYRWKDTVGPAEQRKENWNTWGYMQSYGIGFYEYFCLCEEIGALPLPVVGSGVLCQAREPREAPLDGEDLAAWTQDILDLLEFALGGPETEWGGLRCAMGHEAPFDLRYLAIGNENWADIYFNRYAVIREAVREAYPEITCIVANGPVADGSLFNASRAKILRAFSGDVADEHYYMDSGWFLRNSHRYDQYPRTTKVFLGEYAAHEPASGGRRPNNLYSALCEAAYLTGIERNSDVVTMCCYAPLMARLGMDQWTPDLIWFSGTGVIRTPNYYIQQMFSETLGDWVLQSSLTDSGGRETKETESGLYHIATKTEDGTVYLKIVNVSGSSKEIRVVLNSAEFPAAAEAEIRMLSGGRQDVNTLYTESVIPENGRILFAEGQAELTLPGFAAAVLTLRW